MRSPSGRSMGMMLAGLLVSGLIGSTPMPSAAEETGEAVEPYRNAGLPVDQRVDDLLGRLTLEEKISLLAGRDGNSTRDIPRLGIPALFVTDGPHGVGWGYKSTAFPSGVSMGACWNPELVHEVGAAIARETRASGRQVILGPCVNIHRTPLGGRNFESFSEDPFHAARIAVAYVQGVQGEGVGTSVKHYACNNQEWERTTISVEMDERTLREIYLPAFEAAVKEGDPWTVMGAYNRFRGEYCCENRHLLVDLLKNEFGFNGVLVSDWGAVHGTVSFARGGLDLEMPGPAKYFGDDLLKAVQGKEVDEALIDDKVRRILRILFKAGLFEHPQPVPSQEPAMPEHRALARRLAEEAVVLMKNDGALLPIADTVKSIAVIGPNAAEARVGGGGSSTVQPAAPVSPLEGLKKRCGERIDVRYALGCRMVGGFDRIPTEFFAPPGAAPGEHGLRGEYFDNRELKGEPVVVRVDSGIDFDWGGGSPDPKVPVDGFSARWTGTLTAPTSGVYDLILLTDDGCRLYVDGKLVVDSWIDQSGIQRMGQIELAEGKSYDIRVEYFENIGAAMARFGWVLPASPIAEAVAAARDADVAVVFAGLASTVEGEGYDRTDMELPGAQNELIAAVADANPNTVVVLNGGTPSVLTQWVGKVRAIVQAWYPGQEGGDALAAILFGDVNPSGKLPVTFPMRLEDSPSFGNYPGADGVVRYAEGIFVGYRHFDTRGVKPLFPFGHGLSYTRFKYDELAVAPREGTPGLQIDVSLAVENTGTREGAEVVQLYVRDVEASVERPYKELKGFRKVSLKPGEKKTVSMTLSERDLAFFDPARSKWVAEPGEFDILVGSSSSDIRLKAPYVFRGE